MVRQCKKETSDLESGEVYVASGLTGVSSRCVADTGVTCALHIIDTRGDGDSISHFNGCIARFHRLRETNAGELLTNGAANLSETSLNDATDVQKKICDECRRMARDIVVRNPITSTYSKY
jgi:hypothetical protein